MLWNVYKNSRIYLNCREEFSFPCSGTLAEFSQTILITVMNDTMLYNQFRPFQAADPLEAPLFDEDVEVEIVAKVILFNDEWHTFDEVSEQIIKATGCTADKAETLTLEVHHRGRAMVYEGEMAQCIRVSAILEEISLRTQIEC